MSKYDKDREQLGLKPLGGGTSSSSPTIKSKYDDERNMIKEYQSRQVYQQQMMDAYKSSPELFTPSPEPKQPPEKEWQDDSSRNIPIIGTILKGLDAVANNPIVEKVGEIGRSLYTPGAGMGAVNTLTQGAEALVAKRLPNLVNSVTGRIAQKGLSEAAVGVPLGAAGAQIMNHDATIGETLKGAALGVGAGAGIGMLGRGAKMYVQKNATDLSKNALVNASKNVRTVGSPFADDAVASNPIANSYTKRVGETFGNVGRGVEEPRPMPETALEIPVPIQGARPAGESPLDIPDFLRNRGRNGDEVLLSSPEPAPPPLRNVEEIRRFNESNEGDVLTFRGKVSRNPKDTKVPFSQKWEKIRSQFVDDLASLEGLEKRIRGKLSSAEDSLYKSARLFKGVPEKANQIVKDRLAPIVNEIEKKGYSSADLGDYALAVHAKDVNARDIKSGFTNKEIDQVMIRYANDQGMEAARQQLIKISDDMLKELSDNGVISDDLLNTLRERYPNYVPLFRQFDDEAVNFADGLSKALANVTAPIKTLKGSERKVVDPLENMVKNIFQSTNAAERNKVSQQLSRLAADDVDSKFIRLLDKGEEVGRKNVVSVLQNGEKVRYEVEPQVYKALLNLDKESSNMLIRALQKPASVLRAGATLTPEFSLRNPLRDVVQAFVTSNSGFNPLIDFPVGLMQSISKGDLYKQWVKELGAYGNIISNDRQVHREALERVLKEPPSKKFVNILNGKSLIKVLRAITDTTESATKVGEFRAALRQGQSPQEAAYRSRDIMDFGRAGSNIREANKIVAFLNANIQGKSKLIRSFKENPAGFSARAFSSITVPTIGVFLMQKYMANTAQKQTIDESPHWMKDTFWLVPIPGTDQVARIPKPFDLNVLFSNLPERALNYTFNHDKGSMDGFVKKAIADSALPSMISGLLPFIEGMSNYSFFRQGRIIPQGEDTRELKDQFDINTTETAKLLAKGANAVTGGTGALKNFSSPRIMDSTIKGLTAGLGTYATSAIDVLLDKFNITDNPSRPSKLPSQQPLAKAFLVNPSQSGQSYDELYKLKDKLTRAKGSADLNDKEFKDKDKLEFIKVQTKAMGDITKQIREIQNSKSYSPNYKRNQIERLTRERNKIAQDSMKKLR